MADETTEFRRTFHKIIVDVQEGLERTVKKCALIVDQTVVMATPVDTGRARSNWIVQVNAPATIPREAYAPGESKSTEAANTQAALDQGREAIEGFTLDDASIHITNNLPYIARLNEGSSAQAPAGFVEKAVKAAVDAVNGARILE